MMEEPKFEQFLDDIHNAFEGQTPTDPVFPVNPEIERMKTQITRLESLGLYRTAELNRRKLARLLQEEEGILEG